MKNPSKIVNKSKRSEVYAKYKTQKKKLKKKLRELRVAEVEELGEAAPPKQIPKTIENTRIHDQSLVKEGDDEIAGDEKDDEFSAFFSNLSTPKIMITTRPKCSHKLYEFISDLMQMIPSAFYYPRENKLVKDLMNYGIGKNFTHLVVLGEKHKACNGMLVTQLPHGPTAYFKVSSFQPGAKIPGHGNSTSHIPEIILNNFSTRLGRRIGRFLGSCFPHQPELEGRQVVTFHNQRDFIFVRHHRYVYKKDDEKVRARLQELGPRFTLKLKYLQEGTLDGECGEYEWIYKPGTIDKSKRKFVL